MTLTFKNMAPEKITHDYGAAKYTATSEGNERWTFSGHNAAGTPYVGSIRGNRFEASAQLLSLAMRGHDEAKRVLPSPKMDRVVSVDPIGNDMAAPIYGRVNRR